MCVIMFAVEHRLGIRALYKLFVLKLLLSIFYIVKFLFYHYIAENHENKGKAGYSFKENHSKFEGCYLN